MKIERSNGQPPVIIGKRITVGGLAGALIGILVWTAAELFDVVIPGVVAAHFTTIAIVGLQLWVVNKYGVTT